MSNNPIFEGCSLTGYDEYLDRTKRRRSYISKIKQNNREIIAHISGIITNIKVKVGQVIKTNKQIIVLEAMKMQSAFTLPIAPCKITAICVATGDKVVKGQILIRFEPQPTLWEKLKNIRKNE